MSDIILWINTADDDISALKDALNEGYTSEYGITIQDMFNSAHDSLYNALHCLRCDTPEWIRYTLRNLINKYQSCVDQYK